MKRLNLLAVFLLMIALLSSCSNPNPMPSVTQDPINAGLQRVEKIDDSNRDLIGKEMTSGQTEINPNGLSKLEGDLSQGGTDPIIPENKIVSSLAASTIIPGASIQEIEVSGTTTPELIGPNGAIGIFTKEDSNGWECKAGDTITWSFEKYPLENGNNQTLAVGYIKDGVMYEAISYKEELDGEYQLDIVENGTYFIYFLCASSDPISLKEGNLAFKVL